MRTGAFRGRNMSNPKVLILEPIHKVGIDYLNQEGCDVVFPDSLEPSALTENAREVKGIIVRTRGRVSRELIASAAYLKVIGRHGVGLENIDVEAATELGIQVVNTPLANAESVAEHFLALALMVSKRLPQTARALRSGDWNARNAYIGNEFYGKTVGLIGFGRVGQAIARICRRAFDSRIVYYSRNRAAECERELGVNAVSLEELLSGSDFIALCLPLTSQTEGLIAAKQLALIKPSAFIINLSHGRIWSEGDLYVALRNGQIAGAATDVFAKEPASPDHPLFQLDNFCATPHTAAQTEESLRRMAMVAEDLVRVLRGQPPLHPVNHPAGRRP
jgi:D-3-phosphoglycerate dehydrogenase / 2-oxoglutarate reductase